MLLPKIDDIVSNDQQALDFLRNIFKPSATGIGIMKLPVRALLATWLTVLLSMHASVCDGRDAAASAQRHTPHKTQCPEVYKGEVNIPPSRLYRLSAEPKSGTTWLQVTLMELMERSCDLYNRTANFRCFAECLYPRSDAGPETEDNELSASNTCRIIEYRYYDDRNGADNSQQSRIVLDSSDKHIVPYISTSDHPNETPIFHLLPGWLRNCVDNGIRDCRPALQHMRSSSDLEDFGPILEDAITNNRTLSEVLKLNEAAFADVDMSFPSLRRTGYYTIVRDPRSVVVSAANYNPGKKLFGIHYQDRDNVNEYAVSAINTTTTWTQFRHSWFKLLGLAIPIHTFYYDELVLDPVPALKEWLTFAGVCFNDQMIFDIAKVNTQSYYKEHGENRIQSVVVTRNNRPNNTLTGFLQELESEVRCLCCW